MWDPEQHIGKEILHCSKRPRFEPQLPHYYLSYWGKSLSFIKAHSLICKMRNVLHTLFELYHIILRTEFMKMVLSFHFTKGNCKGQKWQVIPPGSSAGKMWSELGFSEAADQMVYFMGGWKNLISGVFLFSTSSRYLCQVLCYFLRHLSIRL